MPPYLHVDANFFDWMTVLFSLLQKPIPPGEPVDPEERKEWAWWKSKKKAAEIFTKLYSRYSDLKGLEANESKEFAKKYVSIYAPKLLETFLTALGTMKTGHYLPPGLIHASLSFLNTRYS